MKALLLEGLGVTQIERELGVSKATVRFHKRALGIEVETKFARRYDWAEIRAYYDAGHSMKECRLIGDGLKAPRCEDCGASECGRAKTTRAA